MECCIQFSADFIPCLNHISSLKDVVQEVIVELREVYVVRALEKLAEALNTTQNLCYSTKDELSYVAEKLLKFEKSLFLLQFFRGRIKDNVDQMIDDWYEGVDKLRNEEYFNAGEAFGKIPEMIWSGPNNTIVDVDYSK